MLVDVVRMRAAGAKIAPEQLKAAVPVRGRLVLSTRPWRETWRPHVPTELTTFAYLFDHLEDDPIAQPMLELRAAHVNRLDLEGLVVVGIERSGDAIHPVDEAQAWWCRLVSA